MQQSLDKIDVLEQAAAAVKARLVRQIPPIKLPRLNITGSSEGSRCVDCNSDFNHTSQADLR